MHAYISGTVDYYEPDDASCLKRLRALVDMLPRDEKAEKCDSSSAKEGQELYSLEKLYDVHTLLESLSTRTPSRNIKLILAKPSSQAMLKLPAFQSASSPTSAKPLRQLKERSKLAGSSIQIALTRQLAL